MNKKIILFDIDYTLFDTDSFKESNLEKHSLYEEVRDVLQHVAKIADLGIFSEGKLDFQKTKLFNTDIHALFNKDLIHIVEKKDEILEKVLEKYKKRKLILVDDKLTVLYLAKKHFPNVKTIWVKRGKYALSQKLIEDFEPDGILENLSELMKVIKEVK